MVAHCKRNYLSFIDGEYYVIESIHSVFVKDDFITLRSKEDHFLYRFRMNKSSDYIEGYIGENELYFYDYFNILTEERKKKINKIKEIINGRILHT